MSKSHLNIGGLGIVLIATLAACGAPLPTPVNPAAPGPVPAPLKDEIALVFVPAGKLEMGDEDYRGDGPLHAVDLNAFWIDQTEVTNQQYAKCVEQGVLPAARTSQFLFPTKLLRRPEVR